MAQADIGNLLAAADRNDPLAWDKLMALVYEDLKRIAHIQMSRIAPGQTLTTTILVHETFEKLALQQGLKASDRGGFYALCACAMRHIIIDHYRRRAADKRSADDVPGLAAHEHARTNPEADNMLEQLGCILDELVRRDERMVRVFEMRYFAGMSDAEIADRFDLSTRSVQRIAACARAWIIAALEP